MKIVRLIGDGKDEIKKIEIKDWRGHHITTVDDDFIDKFARHVGVDASMVYIVLCRHAGVERLCWPSIELISDKLSISQRLVMRSVKLLERHKMVKVERPRGSHNTYHLLEKLKWKVDVSYVQHSPGKKATKVERDGVKVTWEGENMRPMRDREGCVQVEV